MLSNIPVSETIAGKGTLTHDDPINIGPIGVVGSTSANYAAKNADLVIALGTRLQDFTTGAWTNFKRSTKTIPIVREFEPLFLICKQKE